MACNNELEKIIACVEVFLRFLNDIGAVYEVSELVECPMLSPRFDGVEVSPNNLDKSIIER